jgi:hypothetical protein
VDVYFLGVYSTEARAQDRMRRARTLPGFAAEPGCFIVAEYTLDEDHWTEGFVALGPNV